MNVVYYQSGRRKEQNCMFKILERRKKSYCIKVNASKRERESREQMYVIDVVYYHGLIAEGVSNHGSNGKHNNS